MRIEIRFTDPILDGRSRSLSSKLSRRLSRSVQAFIIDVILPEAELAAGIAIQNLSDTVVQTVHMDGPAAASPELEGWNWLLETAWKPGVTDTLAITARSALALATGGDFPELASARQYLLYGEMDDAAVAEIASRLHNPLIQSIVVISRAEWDSGKRPPASYPGPKLGEAPRPDYFPLAEMSDSELEKLSAGRLLALSLEEMQAIRAWFSESTTIAARQQAGLPPQASDIEIEMLAQTWSEHCKHKIFNARIDYHENGKPVKTVDSVFKTYIRGLTEELAPKKPFLRSVFTDNAGVVSFYDGITLCIKAETHNSPSALDPYGGAMTGIVGVNRDILGTGMGAKPIFNTNVLCFGYPDTPAELVPGGLIHPADVLDGVHKGVVDGGNQSGVPTVAGAFLFDDSFMGKPLVFCGTGGIMPETVNGKPSWEKGIEPGAFAVMLGGRIGKDGIHGATFSSLALDENSPVSAVQLGDPIIQRRMTDFLLEARDLGLYDAITDNGAGGLSSSLGEMAEFSGGVDIDLDSCPLKYPGLRPWEILVSESQERMSLAVPPQKWDEFSKLAKKRDVEATVVGKFTDSGYVRIMTGGKVGGLLSLDFLHDGLPRMKITANYVQPKRAFDELPEQKEWSQTLMELLAEPNIASKEVLVREYDHEVQARSVEKPFTGIERDAPSDGAVVRAGHKDHRGITVSHGICPRYSEWDTASMARMAVDEAYRAHIALGGDPELAAALDNFCWPDPVESEKTPDGAFKAAQLVRACEGLSEACRAYGLPLVSGKDSMKNDAWADGKKISVKPTLLVTLMGGIQDVRKAISTDFLAPGDLIYILGETNGELGCTVYEQIMQKKAAKAGLPLPQFGKAPDVELEKARKLYHSLARAISGRIVSSCHDCSDGGLAVAIAESCLGGRLGVNVDVSMIPGSASGMEIPKILFSETGGRFIVSIRSCDRERFESTMSGSAFKCIGKTDSTGLVEIRLAGTMLVKTSLYEIEKAFKTPIV